MNSFEKLYKSIINEDNGLNPAYKILEITIGLDNGAFTSEDENVIDNIEYRNIEIIRILEKIISDIKNGKNIEDNNWPLADINGNVVGSLKYIEN